MTLKIAFFLEIALPAREILAACILIITTKIDIMVNSKYLDVQKSEGTRHHSLKLRLLRVLICLQLP